MFDDHAQAGGGTPPPNLPIGEPEDIFKDTIEPVDAAEEVVENQPQAKVQAPPVREVPQSPPEVSSAISSGKLQAKEKTEIKIQNPPVQDVFAAIDHTEQAPQALSSAQDVNAQPFSPLGIGTPPPPGNYPGESYTIKKPGIGKAIIVIVILIFVLAGIVGAAWWAYGTFVSSNGAPATQQQSSDDTFQVDIEDTTNRDQQVEDQDDTSNQPLGSVDAQNQIIDDIILFGQPIDSDEDGLEDTEERELGTDPNNWDTDNDELSDGAEILSWNTDPLNKDTDGDSYLDGVEVRSGYSPTGPGKIFIPGELNNEEGNATSTKPVFEEEPFSSDVSKDEPCTEEQYAAAYSAAIASLSAQGHTINGDILQDPVLLPLLAEEIKRNLSLICQSEETS